MTSKERILAAINGTKADHVPLTTWCFGFSPPQRLRWERNGHDVRYWYSKRMEHIHTMEQPWTLGDDFRRVQAWLSLGIDDILDVSVPWGRDPEVLWRDAGIPAGVSDKCPVLERHYQTPGGPLRHAIRQTGEDPGAGWVTQPDHVELIEDYNIPRGVEHAVSRPSDIGPLGYLYRGPGSEEKSWFAERMSKVRSFAEDNGVAVQAWSAFGMDAAVWFCGTEGAIMMAMDAPEAFGQLMEIIAAADLARTELAVSTAGVDMVVERGWYSSTELWSPDLFDRYVYPHVRSLASLAHRHGKKFAYTMTTGVKVLGPRLADAGVDVLYFVDPVQDGITPEEALGLLDDRMTLVGGTNALSLASRDRERIRREVRQAVTTLGPTQRFILHPVDAIFPDTPWEGVEQMIEAWKEFR
jgi:hypothetical protein